MVSMAKRDEGLYAGLLIMRRLSAVCLLLVATFLVAGRLAPVDAQSLEE